MPLRASNLSDLLEQSCRAYATRPALGVRLGGSWWWVAYGELLTLVEAMRGGLAGLGVGRGDAVAILSANRLEWVVACYAVCGLGAALVPLEATRPPRQHASALADSRARVAIAAADAAAWLRQLAADLPALAHVVELDWPADGAGSYRALLDAGRRRPVAAVAPAPGDTAALIYDQASRAAALSHGDAMRDANTTSQLIAAAAGDRALTLLSWARTFGHGCALHALLGAGCPIVVGERSETVADDARATQATILLAESAALARLSAPVDEQIASRPLPLRPILRRGLAAAARVRRGESLAMLDAAAFGVFRRLVAVPPTTLRRVFVAGRAPDMATVWALAARGVAVQALA